MAPELPELPVFPEVHRTASPIEHFDRVSQGYFPPDTQAFLTELFNQQIQDPQHAGVYGQLRRHQRNKILQKLWDVTPGNSALAKSKAIRTRFLRFSGRVLAQKPETALYARLRELESLGAKVPCERHITRICGDSGVSGC